MATRVDGLAEMSKNSFLCVKELLELQITYKPYQWSLRGWQKINSFPETEQKEKLTEVWRGRWKCRKAKQGIFKTALCAKLLMHWLCWDYNMPVKSFLLKITSFSVNKETRATAKPQVCKPGDLCPFPSSREEHHVCIWVSKGRPSPLLDCR